MIEYLLLYFFIGSILTLILDQIFTYSKIEEPLTTSEALVSLSMWPLMLVYTILLTLFGDWRD